MSTPKPLVVSCGDPAGIGPEIAQKAWHKLRATRPFVWLGDPKDLPLDLPWGAVSDPAEATQMAIDAMPVLPVTTVIAAERTIAAIEQAVELVTGGDCSALCTAPINKKTLQTEAGFACPGHTEFLAQLSDVKTPVMMLASTKLRVVPTTIHIPLCDVAKALTPELLTDTLRITHAALVEHFGIPQPRIAVAGLNPHAGEGGQMGREEIDVIAPVIEALQAQNLLIEGPLSADTMFHEPARARYDAAVCMYHDQALIPIKTLAFDEGVNVTLGLPFVRTSPDHGTAPSIAGQGIANPSSMIAALEMAWSLARGD